MTADNQSPQEEDEAPGAGWNQAKLTFLRIDAIKIQAHSARMGRNYPLYIAALESLFSELYSRMTKDEQRELLKELSGIKTSPMLLNPEQSPGGRIVVFDKDFYDSVFMFELKLRQIEERQGMNLPDKDDPFK